MKSTAQKGRAGQAADAGMIGKLMLRLLPIQVMLAVVSSVNGIVSSYFASNHISVEAMGAVGLFSPLNMLLFAVSLMLTGGASILCGKYMGQNARDEMQNVFSVSVAVSGLTALFFAAVFALMGGFDLTGFLTRDEVVRPLLNRYLLGQAIGVLPLMLGNQLAAFLFIENRTRLTFLASLANIAVNTLMNLLFVLKLRMGAFGLALSNALGLWTFLLVQAWPFVTGASHFRFRLRGLAWGECGQILKIGAPGALSNGYQTIRGLLVNEMILLYVGSAGVSAFATADNVMRIFWAVPTGMVAVSRLLLSVSYGEEDRQTLTDVMRVMFTRFLPLQGLICAGIILCAEPFTRLFFQDPTAPVYEMTVWGLRILPICMPLSIIAMHFTALGQITGRKVLVHGLALLDGVVCVAGYTALLIRWIGMNSAYVANILNGLTTTLFIVAFAWWVGKRFPRSMDALMSFPAGFGAKPEDRMDLTVRDLDQVVSVARRVQEFCLSRGVDPRRANLSGLAMEEMAGNVVEHGFTKDKKRHAIDLRVTVKDSDVILRIKDDCVPFDPGTRKELRDPSDPAKNIGIRMIYQIARDIQYQNMMGINVLQMRI